MLRKLLLVASVAVSVGVPLALLPGPVGAKPPSNVAGGEAYQTNFQQTIDAGSNGGNFFSMDPVPADRRLVVEFVSVTMIVPTGQKPIFALEGRIGGYGLPYLIPLTYEGPASIGDLYRATAMVRVYHDGNGTNGPGALCSRDIRDQGPASCSITLSGYLIGK